MLKACRILPCLLLLILFYFISFSQKLVSDSITDNSGSDRLQLLYENSVGASLHLYNGREYLRNSQLIKGSPFIVSDDLQKGSLFYDGTYYRNVDLNFDVANDLVVIKDYSKSFPLTLVPAKLSYFTIGDRFFVNLSANDGPVEGFPNGIVERVFDTDSVKVYARRIKKLFRPLNANTEDNMSVYRDYDRYFIFRQNKYSSFSDLKEMLGLLGEAAPKMRKFARSKKVKLKRISDEDIRNLLSYYIQIKS